MADKPKDISKLYDLHTNFNADSAWATEIINRLQRFITKNSMTAEFFGGNLLGVHPVRWLPNDTNLWMDDIMGIDDLEELQDDIYEQDDINPEWHVSSNPINLSFIYALHRLHNAKIPEKLKKEAMISALSLALIKHLTSGIKRRFEFNADPAVSIALYESLDKKNDLKRLGSWIALIRHRATVMITGEAEGRGFFSTKALGIPGATMGAGPRSNVHEAWKEMDDNLATIFYANAIRGNIVKTLNRMTEKFHVIHKSKSRITSRSTITTVDGEKMIKSYVSKPANLIRDMDNICKDVNDLIRNDLLKSTVSIITTSDEENIRDTLKYYSENYYGKMQFNTTTKTLVLYILERYRRGVIDVTDIPGMVLHIKNMFSTSRTTNKDIIKLKEDMFIAVENALPKAGARTAVSTRFGVLLYLTLRILSINHYR